MARTFTVSDGGMTTVGATTLGWVNPLAAPNIGLSFLRFWCGQSGTPAASQQRVDVQTQVTAFPTVVGVTPQKNNKAEAASLIVSGTGAAGTSGVNASAEGAGAVTTHQEDTFHVQNGWLWVATPGEIIVMPAGFASGIGVRLPIAPTTTSNWCVGMVFSEG